MARRRGVILGLFLCLAVAGFTALGLGRESRLPAAVICTSVTAAGNLLPAALEAHHAGVPLLLLTADRPPELRGVGANQTKVVGARAARPGDPRLWAMSAWLELLRLAPRKRPPAGG